MPKILVPTTAGTGSEATKGAVFSCKEKVEETSLIEAAMKAINCVRKLIGDTLKLPTKLRDLEIQKKH